ncbi:hypothetical protein [Methylovirgula sp. HY1]|uniref:hypothetical protein n=1 Tax=Methylovirgula sp. HY1 TaxID=2822761 RepID=UPI001C5B9113|nr:hypothetical protein [Methylovirgula sp. HY1]QXX75845.1 hypothetical protein MHY1_02677 [Methylovirgula sp. HY1]
MPRSYSAFLTRPDVPARKALQQAVDSLKLKLSLDDAYVPFETSGYVPCTFDGEDAGFDMRFQDVEANLRARVGDKDVAIAFRWGGDPREEASVLIVCAALAKNFGALVYEPDTDVLHATDEVVAKARKAAACL